LAYDGLGERCRMILSPLLSKQSIWAKSLYKYPCKSDPVKLNPSYHYCDEMTIGDADSNFDQMKIQN